MKKNPTGDRVIAVFLLALLAFSPPALAIFQKPGWALGVPLFYLFLFAAWGVVIAAMAWAARGAGREEGGPGAPSEIDAPARGHRPGHETSS